MWIDALLISVILLITGSLIFKSLRLKEEEARKPEEEEDRLSLEKITEFVKEEFNELLKSNIYMMNLSREEYSKRVTQRAQLRRALKHCAYGDLNSKEYIKSYIRDMLVNSYEIQEDNIDKAISFENSYNLTGQDKFEICLYHYKKTYQYNALEKMLIENSLDGLKDEAEGFYIEKEDIDRIYEGRGIRLYEFEDKLEVLVQRIYQKYKGFGVIDEIRDMRIDGVSGGVSGIAPNMQEIDEKTPCSHDSVWIFFKGKTIHLRFLSFGSENELIRVCKNIYKFNSPGQLSESNGYKVNEMKDGSRVVVARPPFSESWVFFVRKFDSISSVRAEELITDNNAKLPIELMKWLVKGCRVTAITGSQGTGKTTLLMSVIKYINPSFALRIQEMSFELQLRKLYPERNILTFRETTTISGQEGLNLQKKTDGVVNILGEVAEAGMAVLMIQMSQIASLFTLFTHHAKTTEHLVYSIRNNLLQTGAFTHEKIAEQQVLDVLNFDIHLNKSAMGHRYIERITEIVPSKIFDEYPQSYKEIKDKDVMLEAFMDNVNEFFCRMTDRKSFEARDIVVYCEGEYKALSPISEKMQEEMTKFFSAQEKEEFRNFIDIYWSGVI